MPGKALSIAELKATFSERLRDVESGETILITRNGKAVAALFPIADLQEMERLRSAGPENGLASLAGGWPGSEELVQILENSPRIGFR